MAGISGRCLCGSLTWHTNGDILWSALCHCEDCRRRVSDLLCMSNLSHASILKEHDNNDDFQGRSRRTA